MQATSSTSSRRKCNLVQHVHAVVQVRCGLLIHVIRDLHQMWSYQHLLLRHINCMPSSRSWCGVRHSCPVSSNHYLPPCTAYCRGEASVTQGGRVVNRLFKADYFGERALLSNEPRGATVVASQETVCLVLDRDTFVEILGPLDKVMAVSGLQAWHTTQPY